MTWVRLDDAMPSHPKILELSEAEFAFYVALICYANQHQTDGKVSEKSLKTVRWFRKNRIAKLVETGLLIHSVPGEYEIHDFNEYQRSKASIQAERDSSRERQARWRDAHRNGVTGRFNNAVTNAVSNTAPTHPIKEKDLTVQEDSTDEGTPLVLLRLLEAMSEPEHGQAHLELLAFKARGSSEADFRAATSAIRKHRPTKPRGYTSTILTNRLAERSTA